MLPIKKIQKYLTIFLVGFLPIAAFLHPNFMTLTLILLSLIGLGHADFIFYKQYPRPLQIVFMVFVCYLIINTAINPAPLSIAKDLFKFIGIFFLGLLWVARCMRLPAYEAMPLIRALIAGLFISILMLIINYKLNGFWENYRIVSNPCALAPCATLIAYCILLLAPTLWHHASPKSFFFSFLILSVFAIIAVDYDTPKFGLFISILAIPLMLMGRFCFPCLTLVTVLGVITLPLFSYHFMTDTWIANTWSQFDQASSHLARLGIWCYTSDFILHKISWLGLGIGQSYSLPPILALRIWTPPHYIFFAPPHPHNFVIEWWVDLGVIGAVILCIFCIIIFRLIIKSTDLKWEKTKNLGFVLMIIAIGLVGNYSFWKTSQLSILFLTTGCLFLTRSTLKSNQKDAYPMITAPEKIHNIWI